MAWLSAVTSNGRSAAGITARCKQRIRGSAFSPSPETPAQRLHQIVCRGATSIHDTMHTHAQARTPMHVHKWAEARARTYLWARSAYTALGHSVRGGNGAMLLVRLSGTACGCCSWQHGRSPLCCSSCSTSTHAILCNGRRHCSGESLWRMSDSTASRSRRFHTALSSAVCRRGRAEPGLRQDRAGLAAGLGSALAQGKERRHCAALN